MEKKAEINNLEKTQDHLLNYELQRIATLEISSPLLYNRLEYVFYFKIGLVKNNN